MNKLFIAVLCTGLFSLSACQKRDPDSTGKNEVVITISNPAEAQTFKKGDTVFLTAQVSAPRELHGYTLQIRNTTSGAVYMEKEEHVHDASLDIKTYWVDTLSSNAGLRLDLVAEIDHNGNEATKTVYFNSKN